MGISVDPVNSQEDVLANKLIEAGIRHGQEAKIDAAGIKVFAGIVYFCDIDIAYAQISGDADGKPMPNVATVPAGLNIDDGKYIMLGVPVVPNGTVQLHLTTENFHRLGPLSQREEPYVFELDESTLDYEALREAIVLTGDNRILPTP